MNVCAALFLCLLTFVTAHADWPQWRGPDRNGQTSTEAVTWPDQLEDRLELQWEVTLQPSYSGPLLVGDLVYTTETRDQKDEAVVAFDRASGERRWEHRWKGAMNVPFFARRNGSWIRSTPTVEGNRILMGGMRDVLVCLDRTNGNELWRVDFVARYQTPNPAFGLVCSPLVDGAHVYVQAGAGFCKLRLEDGAEVWRSLVDGGGMYGSAFSSPVLVTIDGTRQLLVLTRTELCGVAPEDGSVLWRQPIEAFRGMNILTPVVQGNRVFTSAYGGRSHAFDLAQGDDGWTVTEAWNQKLQGYMCSPVIVDAHVYFHLRNERFASLHLEDGDIGLVSSETYGKYLSLVRQGTRLLALTDGGELLLIQTDAGSFQLLDRLRVSDQDTWAHLAVDGDQVAVRGLKQLRVFRWKP